MDKHWKLFDAYVGLYKFYWELSVKLVMFTLGISGAIAAYAIKNVSEPYVALGLLIPAVLSLFMAWLAHESGPGLNHANAEILRLAKKLELESWPTFDSLVHFVFVCKFVFALVGVGLVSLWVCIPKP